MGYDDDGNKIMSEKDIKILFVEDEPELVELYGIAFMANGFEAFHAGTGKDTFALLEKISAKELELPRAIILDILLPDISGVEILREIRKRQSFDEVPIVMFTNFSSDEIRKEIDGVKNTQYLLKMETTPDCLVEKIKTLIGA